MKSSFYLVQCTSYMFELNSIFIMYVDVNVEGGNCSIIDELWFYKNRVMKKKGKIRISSGL